MNSWREDALPGHTHDPNEVTVQLDGAGRLLGDLHGVGHDPAAPAAGGAKEVPVFVDDSGRRGRRLRRVGVLVGIACAVYAVAIVITVLSGSSSAPWLPLPSDGGNGPASNVDTQPEQPVEATTPAMSPVGTPSPGASGTVSGVLGEPGASGSPSGGSGADDAVPGAGSGTTTSPGKPVGGRTTPPADPTGSGDTTAKPPVDPPDEPVATTTPPPAGPSPDPSADPSSGGTDTVADGSATGPGSVASPESSVL